MSKRKNINSVFTPRRDAVNTKMYVNRLKLEEEFKRKLNGYKHIIMYGESGSGKSWLYKKVLKDEKIEYSVINLANAKRMGNITNLFGDAMAKIEEYQKEGFSETKSTEANVVVLKGGLLHQNNYRRKKQDPLRQYLEHINKGKGIVVLDNLESIFDHQLCMEELGDILTLLDDGAYNTKFLIVGVPSGVIEYFNSRTLLKTVANRLTELSEVKGLSTDQVTEFVRKGFIEELAVEISDDNLQSLGKHIHWVTNGIPQKIHEYCEALAYIIQKNSWVYGSKYIEEADRTLVIDNLHKNYLLISEMMNSNETEVGRRNQVLYALGKIDKTVFKVNEIEQILRSEFILSTEGKGLNVRLILNELSDWKNSFVKKQGREYIITDTQYVLCIRMMLIKSPTEKIEKKDISSMN